MSFLNSAAKVTSLEAQVAQLTASLAAANANIAEHVATIAGLNTQLTTNEAAASEQIRLTAEKLTVSETALTTEKAAHEATKVSVDALAATKAQAILVAAGHVPIKTESSKSAESIREKYKAMKPGSKERTEFRLKHWEALQNQQN